MLLLIIAVIVHLLSQICEKVHYLCHNTGAGWLKDSCISMLSEVPKLKSGCRICWGGPIIYLCIIAINISSFLSCCFRSFYKTPQGVIKNHSWLHLLNFLMFLKDEQMFSQALLLFCFDFWHKHVFFSFMIILMCVLLILDPSFSLWLSSLPLGSSPTLSLLT